ncbi:hypothetical protein [Nonomuraea fuscirosea]|uniref:hypothetical protein n=1 Tax=Nonomuraea fuscirosea TaxID=1291556 RepID=UPI00343AAD16
MILAKLGHAEDRRSCRFEVGFFWSHLNLYGKFELDMSKQLDPGPVSGLEVQQAS